MSIEKKTVPNHIAIIPDGNRRWAKARGLKPWEGHEEGVKLFWENAYAAFDDNVPHITFWAGSYDNLKKRSKLEVKFLIKLVMDELTKPDVLKECMERKVRFQVIGEWKDFIKDKKALQRIADIEKQTENFKKTLMVLFAYDGQREMLSAINELKGSEITDKVLRKSLWTGELPDVDLVIRTGGEPHWSAGFMMWHTANSQFYFTEKLWPDFKKNELKKALVEYECRERRLGK